MSHCIFRGLLSGTGGGGGGSPFNQDATPPALGGGTGCRLYVARGYGLYTDAGTTLATAAGQAIYRWKDYSGSANHLDQASASTGWRPLAASGAQLTFANPSHLPVPAAVGSGVTDGELFGLVKLDAQPQVGTQAGGLWWFGGNDVSVYPAGANIQEGSGTSTRYTFTAPSGLDAWHVYTVRTSGANWDADKDNSAISGSSHSSNTPDWTCGYVGANLAKSHYLFGQIAAVVFYGGARSAPERAAIVAALLAMAPP